MCGRFVRQRNPKICGDLFGLPFPDVPTSYNAAPTQMVPVVRPGEVALMRWGLVPS
jgi:putative SOS response-associated peptidase YedK